ncbi:hypothetical protein M9Y10_038867 [Tritrichomonas musculus]|uniref:RRM domain-containing protein n=1 Tax=Tritrichomonas musculus TaxID=1915356 RepID=A0ABR2KCS6_9EUKA
MSQDYSSDSSDSYSDQDSYSRHRDDRKYPGAVSSQQDERNGTLFSLKFPPIPFEEYEIWEYVEDTMKMSLADLSAFRNLDGSMTGVVVGQFEEPVTVSRLRRLHGNKFKGSPIEARLFVNLGSFQKYCMSIAEMRIGEASIDTQTTPPHVYVMNFPDSDEQSVKTFFSRCGNVSLTKAYPYKNTQYFTLFFVNEAAARLACRTFDGFVYKNHTLTVAPLFKNAAERSFAVHHVQDVNWLKQEINYFGKIEKFKPLTDNDVFVLMEKLEDAKAACVLLNKKFDNDVQIKTNFIDLQYFNIGDNHY